MEEIKLSDEYKLFLEEEVKLLYKALFRGEVPGRVVTRYQDANLKLLPEPEADFRRAITAKTDIEALELAWRFRSPRNLLTQKVHVLVYLVEATPEHYNHFFNDRKRFFYSFILLALHGVRSVYKLFKGILLLKRYRLV